LLGELFNKSIV